MSERKRVREEYMWCKMKYHTQVLLNSSRSEFDAEFAFAVESSLEGLGLRLGSLSDNISLD